MNDQAFTPGGPTIVVSTAPVQALGTSDPTQRTSYRIRCLVTGYITWSPVLASAQPPTSLTATAPSGTPSENTIGMGAGQTEVFCLPRNAWFAASAATAFEVTPGEGI